MARQQQSIYGVLAWSESAIRALPLPRQSLLAILSLLVGVLIWNVSPSASLDPNGMRFLATLSVAVLFWIFEVLDEYVTALLLMLSWLTIAELPVSVALSGFASSEWFFALSALGMAAAVTKTGLMHRLALSLLKRIPGSFTAYNFVFASAGLLVTPFMPNVKGRMAISMPVTRAISTALGLMPRSNAAAALALSCYGGFSQLSFMFLTGMSSNLIGWNLLPSAARQEFGWVTWLVAALPAGVVMLLLLAAGIRFLFPPNDRQRISLPTEIFESQLKSLGRLSSAEWISLFILVLAITGWLTKPLHGIAEAWVGLGCFLVFILSGVVDKDDVKNGLDWCFMIFFGIVSSMGDAIRHLGIEHWILDILTPVLRHAVGSAELFLATVLFLVYLVRLVLHKAAVQVLFMVGLVPWATSLDIHPGVLLITIILGIESWFLPYQTDSYLLARASSGQAFSHGQAQRVMILKLLASFIALFVSFPYWRSLGLLP
jgi:divalent anion:Na+ symporter, DASS family